MLLKVKTLFNVHISVLLTDNIHDLLHITDLYSVDESEEVDNGANRTRGQRKSAQYHSKEVICISNTYLLFI